MDLFKELKPFRGLSTEKKLPEALRLHASYSLLMKFIYLQKVVIINEI